MLRHWRDELGLAAPVAPDTMPQGGATETVSARGVSPEDVLSFVLRVMEEQGVTEPNVTMADDATWQLPLG